ncbi:MAG: PAS domain S-box protein [Planctomycetes bacterium]|nr:PAS domain S-box protein [Planctomycetota bacterium]
MDELTALRESEQRFRAISAWTYDWESWHGTDRRLLWVNQAVQRITGYSVDDCLQMDDYPLPLVRVSDRPRIADVLAHAAAGIPGNDVEFCVQTRSDVVRWAAISWQSISDDCGRNIGFRTSIRDITDRKRMEQQIRDYTENLEQLVQQRTTQVLELEARRAKVDRLAALGQLAAGVAHEINNPLAGIRNAMELIRGRLLADSREFQLIDLVQSEIDRMAEIVRQLYQLYRPPTSASDVAIDIVRVCEQTVQLLSVACCRRDVRIAVLKRSPAVLARLPEGELKQVLYNVVLNATQATQSGQQVDIAVGTDGEQVTIRIQDQGPGIPPQVLPLIFDPFFTTRHGQADAGMGLGLPVSQSLVQAMGGRIEVDTVVGRGTTFQIVLPRNVSHGGTQRTGAACPILPESES